MPQFEWRPYNGSEATRTIGNIMLRSGEARANAVRDAGQSKAQLVGQVGQEAAGTIGGIMQQRAAEKQHQVIARVLHAATNPDGTYDTAKLPTLLVQAGLTDHVKELTEFVSTANKSRADALHTTAETAKLQAETSGTLPETPAQKAARIASERTATETARHNVATEGVAQTTATRLMDAQAEAARHNAAVESISKLTEGRAEAAQRETARHNRAVETEAAKKDAQAAGDVTALTPEGLDAAAMMFAKTGQLPALGMGDKTTRKQIINRAAALIPGLDIATAKADYTANQGSLKNVTQTLDSLSAFETTAGKNLDQFLSLAEKIPDTGVPWVNAPIRLLNDRLVGSDNQAAFNAARNVALREIARVTNDPKLSGVLSDSARKEVSDLSPQTATFAQIKKVATVLKQDMANVHSSLSEQRDAIQGRIAKGSAKPADAAPAAPAGWKYVPKTGGGWTAVEDKP